MLRVMYCVVVVVVVIVVVVIVVVVQTVGQWLRREPSAIGARIRIGALPASAGGTSAHLQITIPVCQVITA